MTQLTYLIAIEKLKTDESTNLLDMNTLPDVDLDKLFQHIKLWKVHRIHKFNLKPINQKKTYLDSDCKNNN